ncbi:MAG TPA: CvpA family protein, partial [Clostridia bacterium]|nr:CvpA family protein [Clostridia bacterium]
MSWFDLVIILIIGGGALWGYKSGFFSSAFRILSMVASLFIAYTIYPIVSSVFKGSFLFANINKSVVKTLEGIMKGPQFQGAANGAKGSLVNQLVNSLP